MRSRDYEAKDPRISTTIKRCEQIGIKIGVERDGNRVSLFAKNVYFNSEQTNLLNHLNFE